MSGLRRRTSPSVSRNVGGFVPQRRQRLSTITEMNEGFEADLPLPPPKLGGIGRIGMDSDDDSSQTARTGTLRRVKAVRSGLSQLQRKDSYVSDPNLEKTFLPERYLRQLHKFGYTFGKTVGEGKSGFVLECFYKPDLNRPQTIPLVCKKVVLPKNQSLIKNKALMEYQVNPEKLALTLVRHPNVISLQNIWTNYESFDSTFPLFVLFFMEKADSDLWEYLNYMEGVLKIPVDEQEVKYLFAQIVDGLEYLHSLNIAHLDLKPENIVYVKDPITGYMIVKITDFGLCCFIKRDEWIRLYHGTDFYRAPEVENARNGSNRYDGYKADIYSLGQLLRYMIGFEDYHIKVHGNPPPYPAAKCVFITQALNDLLDSMLSSNPQNRPTIQETPKVVIRMIGWNRYGLRRLTENGYRLRCDLSKTYNSRTLN